MKKLFQTAGTVSTKSMDAAIDALRKYASTMAPAKEVYAPKAYTGNTAADLSTQQERANLQLRAFADGYRSGKVVTWYKNEERSLRWWDEEDDMMRDLLHPTPAKAVAPAQEVWDEEQAMFVTR